MDTKIRDTINKKMNQLEDYVDANVHVTSPSKIAALISEIHQFYTQLELEDRQYVDVIDDMISHHTKDDQNDRHYFKSIN
tara:strand:+ start:632 stop:871 length:240 start_codon:yes stop_codon:yes gene_type:complete